MAGPHTSTADSIIDGRRHQRIRIATPSPDRLACPCLGMRPARPRIGHPAGRTCRSTLWVCHGRPRAVCRYLQLDLFRMGGHHGRTACRQDGWEADVELTFVAKDPASEPSGSPTLYR